LKKVKQNAEAHAVKIEFASRSVHDEKALFHEDDADEGEIVLGREWKLKRTWEEGYGTVT
jgi:protein SSD1